MEKQKCKHEKRLPVYGRDEKNWISSLKIKGEMIFICEDCGGIFGEKIIKHDVVMEDSE